MPLAYKWGRISLYFLILAMTLGVVLRLHAFFPMFRINYRFLVHGHSHVVLLGWVFNALCALTIQLFVKNSGKTTSTIFWLFQLSVIGMLITFPIQGYAFYSILFSTLHILLSYVFIVYYFIKTKGKNGWAIRFVRLAMVYFCLSTIGPFSLGPIMVNGLYNTPLYDLAIYFYLHFLYNGFFILMIIGLLLRTLEINNIYFDEQHSKKVFWYLGIAIIPTFAMSALGFYPSLFNYALSIIGGLMQLLATWYLFKLIFSKSVKKYLNSFRAPLIIAYITFVIKMILQLLSSIPALKSIVFESHHLIIAYLHLVFIGVITYSLIGLFQMNGQLNRWTIGTNSGHKLLLMGFVISEILLIYPGLSQLIGFPGLPMYFEALFLFSACILAGVVMMVFDQKGHLHFK